MPISSDPNIPEVAGYVQVVSLYLLDREGNKIDIAGATYVVNNITELDALLALSPEPNQGETDLGSRPRLAAPIVLVKSDYNTTFGKWEEFSFDKTGRLIANRKNPPSADTWQTFAYSGEFDPDSERPCHLGLEFNRHVSFIAKITDEVYGLGDISPSTKIELDSGQDTSLFVSNNPISIPGTIEPVEDNNTACVLGTALFSDFTINGWEFKKEDYPKPDTSSPDPKVKLLWLAGYQEL